MESKPRRWFGYAILINIDFSRFHFFFFSDLPDTGESVSSAFSNTSKFRQKYSAARRIFNFLLDVWKCSETLSLVFDILHDK